MTPVMSSTLGRAPANVNKIGDLGPLVANLISRDRAGLTDGPKSFWALDLSTCHGAVVLVGELFIFAAAVVVIILR